MVNRLPDYWHRTEALPGLQFTPAKFRDETAPLSILPIRGGAVLTSR